jgi:four helix bundle protein
MPFSHEKLHVYQKAISFVAWCEPFLQKLPATLPVMAQLDRASTSIPLNLAEGNGKFSQKDRARYFQISQGSALECAACLDVLVAKGRATSEEIATGNALLVEIVSILMKLLSNLESRIGEDPAEYRVGGNGLLRGTAEAEEEEEAED